MSRAEVIADPPAVQLSSAFTQHARERRRAAIVACGCWSVTALGGQREWLEEEKALCRFGRSKA